MDIRERIQFTCPHNPSEVLQATDTALSCASNGRMYPVLAGIPILHPDPIRWIADHRDAILAALASSWRLSDSDISIVNAVAEMAGSFEAHGFAEDWDLREGSSDTQLDFSSDEVHSLLNAEKLDGLNAAASRIIQGWGGHVLEVGCGVGRFSREMAQLRESELVVLDNNLKALLHCTAAVKQVRACIGDACALPFQNESFDHLAALNLVDLLECPEDFLDDAYRVTKPGGTCLLSTPDPALGLPDGDSERLQRFALNSGFKLQSRLDGLVWTRHVSPRELQVFSTQVLLLSR